MQHNEVVDLRKYREAGAKETAEAPPPYLPAGTKLLLGQYTITDYLNCGGFGITYLAADSLGRKVAIKECFPGELCYRADRAMAARSPKYKDELADVVRHFVAEAHRLASASHPNIVHVHQIFEENDTAYMAMDFVDGPDLLDLVDAEGRRLSPAEIRRVTVRMLEAIRYVHGQGLLHRDISPDNILMRPSGEPVLIDFGAARERTVKGQRGFSRLKFVKDGYSPQEFYIAGGDQGPWSDLYSFAASMYHAITGAPPVDGQSRLAALAAKKPDPFVPLAGRVEGYPERFLKAIDTALAALPEKRFQSAEEWLEAVSEPEPVVPVISKPVGAVMDVLSASKPRARAGRFAAGLAVLAALGAGVLALSPGLLRERAPFDAVDALPAPRLVVPVPDAPVTRLPGALPASRAAAAAPLAQPEGLAHAAPQASDTPIGPVAAAVGTVIAAPEMLGGPRRPVGETAVARPRASGPPAIEPTDQQPDPPVSVHPILSPRPR